LFFDIGLVGRTGRITAEQYLDANGNQPKGLWTRKFWMTHQGNDIHTNGLQRTNVPPLVGMLKPPSFRPGECW